MTALRTEISLRGSVKSSVVVGFISGLAGLVMLIQDAVIASHFATGGAADAYQLAISFPTLALNVFAGGTLLAVLVPLLTRLTVENRDVEVKALVKRVRLQIGGLLLAACVIWIAIYPYLIDQIASGFSFESLKLSGNLLWFVAPVLLFSGLASVDAAVLNSRQRFIFISTMPAFLPAGVVLCVFFLVDQLGIYAAACGLLIGSVVQWCTSYRLTAPLIGALCPSPSALKWSELAKNYLVAAASAAMLAGIVLTDTFMASSGPPGSAATYGYAVRPVILILAFVTAVIGNVVLPSFSRLAAISDWQSLKTQVIFWFGLLTLGSLPFIALWHDQAISVVALLYEHGAFAPADTAKVAAVQQIYMLQTPFFLVGVIGWRVLNSLNQNRALLIITAVCFLVNLATDIWMTPSYGLKGIAWGTNLAFTLWAILITFYMIKIHSTRRTQQPANFIPHEKDLY